MENFIQSAEALLSNLERFFKTDTVVGQPIKVGETTLIPLITVSFGCGTGSGGGNDKSKIDISGEGLGAGAKVSPTAILVVKNDDVSLIMVKEKAGVESFTAMIPEILSKLNFGKSSPKTSEEVKDGKMA